MPRRADGPVTDPASTPDQDQAHVDAIARDLATDDAAAMAAVHQAVTDTRDAEQQLMRSVVDTEQDLTEREASLGDLARRIEDGEDVDPGAIPEQRRIIDHVRMRLSGLRSRRSRATVDSRLARLRVLREEITQGVRHDDDRVAALMTAAEDATAAVIVAVNERDTRVRGWLTRLTREQVPPYLGQHPEPSPAHAGLATATHGVAAGALRVRTDVAPDVALTMIRRNAEILANGETDHRRDRPTMTTVVAEPPADACYFRDKDSGFVVMYDAAHVPGHYRSASSNVVEISADEARAAWHGGGVDGQAVTHEQAQAVGRVAS